jgi:diaminopimelate epimerase
MSTTTNKDGDYCMRNTVDIGVPHTIIPIFIVVVDIGVPHTIIPIFIVCC